MNHEDQEQRRCKWCGKTLVNPKPKQKFCSGTSCRTKHWHAMHDGAPGVPGTITRRQALKRGGFSVTIHFDPDHENRETEFRPGSAARVSPAAQEDAPEDVKEIMRSLLAPDEWAAGVLLRKERDQRADIDRLRTELERAEGENKVIRSQYEQAERERDEARALLREVRAPLLDGTPDCPELVESINAHLRGSGTQEGD